MSAVIILQNSQLPFPEIQQRSDSQVFLPPQASRKGLCSWMETLQLNSCSHPRVLRLGLRLIVSLCLSA